MISEIIRIKEFIEDPTCILINELDICFGCARIDVAVINGQIHGYEIKSERDNLERLPAQMDLYNKVFDTLTLVISEKHYDNAIEIIPEWWGLFCIKKNKKEVSLKVVRNPIQNINVEPINVAQLLWKDELYELLQLYGLSKGVKNKTRYELSKLAEKKISPIDISLFTRDKLKCRKSGRALQLQQLCGDLHILQPN